VPTTARVQLSRRGLPPSRLASRLAGRPRLPPHPPPGPARQGGGASVSGATGAERGANTPKSGGARAEGAHGAPLRSVFRSRSQEGSCFGAGAAQVVGVPRALDPPGGGASYGRDLQLVSLEPFVS
jgi:hypothetical protein